MTEEALHYPATARNREPIATVLQSILPEAGRMLEIASGSGEHTAFFAPRFPKLDFQPTDIDPGCLRSIDAHCADLQNVFPALALDVTVEPWPIEVHFDVIYCANMIHIAPWEATLGLLSGAGRRLGNGAPLVLYGPFMRGGRHTAPSNEAFDRSLRERDPRWGVRDLDLLAEVARVHGLVLGQVVEMPANNLVVVLRASNLRL